MGVKATLKTEISVVETIEGAGGVYLSEKDRTVTHSGLNFTKVMDGASDVPATKVAAFEKALSSGTGTIDLTALTGTAGGSVSFSGLKVQAAKFRNKSTNANSMVIAEGASNGYELLGDGFEITLKPGQEITLYLREEAPDVGGSAKTIDITGTGSQVLECILVAG